MNPLRALADHGQSVWLDYLRRGLITSGELERLIAEDGLRGLTSNPAILEKAIAGSTDYREALAELQGRPGQPAEAVYERLAVADICDAADILKPVYQQTRGRDGYVSLEVSPSLARDTDGTLAEARRLWRAVGRPNLMVKVPATPEGIPAIRALIGEGINVNATLLFSPAAYEQVAEAYLAGLEARARRGGDLGGVASVASFCLGPIDTAIEARLAPRLGREADPGRQALLKGLRGRVAIASARLAYQRYKAIVGSPRWQALAARGARTQRLLWARISARNPQYRDVMYVEELIGPDTVSAFPPATLAAFRDHGRVRPSLEEDLEGARDTLDRLAGAGISLPEVADGLLAEGLALFGDSFEKLLRALEARCRPAARTGVDRQIPLLPPDLTAAVKASLEEWQAGGKVRRLWGLDAGLWTGSDEGRWLGWLGATEDRSAPMGAWQAIAEEVRRAGFSHALLLGMGGSSLCPEVLKMTFGKFPGHPELHVLDSTDPSQVKALEGAVDLGTTLFIVSSKSGSTLEPNIFKAYFFDRVSRLVGPDKAGERFMAITDPGSALQQVAERDGFRHIAFGDPAIGGRYSALSAFGMVPAAVMGLDVGRFLDLAEEMVCACSPCVPIADNPGALLGTILGVAARSGRDKLTIVASPGIGRIGAWLEQLLAESTGKDGKGLIPVDREALGPPGAYGPDRLFAYLRLEDEPDAAQDAAMAALERAGQPVVRIAVPDRMHLGQEFFRWEIATAVAGSLLGIHPFNQPDVEASKIATRQLTDDYERTGSLAPEAPILAEGGLQVFTDEKNAAALAGAAGRDPSLPGWLRAHLDRLRPGDYLALLAYVEMCPAHEEVLQQIRVAVRDRKRVATCLGFGPRFLHSTGQAYKGGPNSGVFLQITCDDAADLPIPGRRCTFGVVKAAQARGDFEVLARRGRRALRVHLGPDVRAGLAALRDAVLAALR